MTKDFIDLDDVQIVQLHSLCEQELFRRVAKKRIEETINHIAKDFPEEQRKAVFSEKFPAVMTGAAQETAEMIGDFSSSFLKVADALAVVNGVQKVMPNAN